MSEINLIPIEPEFNGKSSWDSTMIKFKSDAEACAGEATWQISDSRLNSDRSLAFFMCPGCSHVEHSSCKAFQTYDLDKKQKCNKCQVCTSVKSWKCECNKFWHKCTIHRFMISQKNNPSMMRETNRQNSQYATTPRAKIPRSIGPHSYELMVAEDRRNAKRRRDEDDEYSFEPNIILGIPRIKTIKVSSLGPILKRRFIYG